MDPLEQVALGEIYVEPPHEWEVLALGKHDERDAYLLVQCSGCGQRRVRVVPVAWCQFLIEDLDVDPGFAAELEQLA